MKTMSKDGMTPRPGLPELTFEERKRLLALAKTAKLNRTVNDDRAPIAPIDRGGALPLSPGQQRLWFLSQFDAVSRAYQIACRLRLRGALDREALYRALDRIVARHEALRTRFPLIQGQPVQAIDPEDRGLPVVECDLARSADVEAALEALVAEEAAVGLDLERGPLIRARLAVLGEDHHALLLTMHHIVSDGWSMGVFVNELSALYVAYREGKADPLPPLAIQYADYAAWQRERLGGERLQRQSEHWRKALAGAPARLDVPTDRVRPPEQDYAGGGVEVVLDSKLSLGLKSLAQRHGSTLYMTLLAAWGTLLGRLAGQDDVVIGSPSAGRTRAETEPLIGFFVNTLAVRLKLGRDLTVSELLRMTRTQVLEAQEHGDLPFEQVVEVVQPPRSLEHTPLFQAVFVWQNTPGGTLSLPGLRLSNLSAPTKTAPFELTLELQETEEGIRGGLNYATALFDESTVHRYAGYLRRILEGMVRDDAQLVSRIPWMDPAELQRVVVDWNETGVEFAHDRCLHVLFEEQAERAPDAVALLCGEESLSYRELNARANRLAHHLRALGVGPDARVAICMDRSLEMVVALLATLKAGGAYVPLDPAYPEERLAYALEDSAPKVLLIHGPSRAALAGVPAGSRVVDLDADGARGATRGAATRVPPTSG